MGICPEDCSVCPDGLCTGDEDVETCPDDCPAVCGDGHCTPEAEPYRTCPEDCCVAGEWPGDFILVGAESYWDLAPLEGYESVAGDVVVENTTLEHCKRSGGQEA
jgi:hypothetical protein